MPGVTQQLYTRPLQSPHEMYVHPPSRVEDYIFSHLPLHSQQLPRSPCPMIPIGGIQMVQARPSSHPSLGARMSLPGSCFAPRGMFSEPDKRGKEASDQQEPSPSSASATPPLQSSRSDSEEKIRTSELHQNTAKEEYRVKTCADPCGSKQVTCLATGDSSCPKDEHSPTPSTSGEEPSGKKGRKQHRSSSTSFEPTCMFISDVPTQTLERSNSTSCLAEPPSSQSPPCPLSIRRRNLSGELAPQGGSHRRSSPPLEQAGFSLLQRQVEDKAGST